MMCPLNNSLAQGHNTGAPNKQRHVRLADIFKISQYWWYYANEKNLCRADVNKINTNHIVSVGNPFTILIFLYVIGGDGGEYVGYKMYK